MNQVDHQSRAHAEFGPSSLKYVATCSGYQGKQNSSAASEMGTRIHEALEVRDASALTNEEEIAIYDQIITEEDDLFLNVFGPSEGVTINREIRLVLELDCQTPTFGTCDVLAWRDGEGLAIDYKTGISKIDEPVKNWQAKAYALAAFQMYDHLETLHFAFIVPKRGETLIGRFDRSDVPKLRDEISSVIRIAERTRPKWSNGTVDLEELNPTTNCRYCLHEDRCPALGAVCLEIAKRYKPEAMLPEGPIASSDVEDPKTIEQLYLVAKIVESWASGIKSKAVTMAMDGQDFESLKLRSLGSVKKTVEKNYLAQLAIRYGLDLTEVIEAADLTLSQLSKALHDKSPKGQKAAVVGRFENEAIDLGIVEIGSPRFTLSSR